MNHVLGDVSTRKLTEQPPVDKLVCIEWTTGTPIEKRVPAYVVGGAIGRDGTHPLTASVRGVAAHPGFHMRDLPGQSLLDPLPGVRQRTRAFMLYTDGHHLFGILG